MAKHVQFCVTRTRLAEETACVRVMGSANVKKDSQGLGVRYAHTGPICMEIHVTWHAPVTAPAMTRACAKETGHAGAKRTLPNPAALAAKKVGLGSIATASAIRMRHAMVMGYAERTVLVSAISLVLEITVNFAVLNLVTIAKWNAIGTSRALDTGAAMASGLVYAFPVLEDQLAKNFLVGLISLESVVTVNVYIIAHAAATDGVHMMGSALASACSSQQRAIHVVLLPSAARARLHATRTSLVLATDAAMEKENASALTGSPGLNA